MILFKLSAMSKPPYAKPPTSDDDFDQTSDIYLDPLAAPENPIKRQKKAVRPPLRANIVAKTKASLELEEDIRGIDAGVSRPDYVSSEFVLGVRPQGYASTRPTSFPDVLFADNEPMRPNSYLLFSFGACSFLAAFNWCMPRAIESAKAAGSWQGIVGFYFVWLVIDCFGFAFVSRWTIRRWMDATNLDALPRAAAWCLRGALLSPLLALVTVIASIAWPSCAFADQARRRRRIVFAMGTSIFAFHLLWSYFSEQAARREGRAQVEGIDGQALPYAPLSFQYAYRLTGDLDRLDGIERSALKGNAEGCSTASVYFGLPINDCFVRSVEIEARRRRFVAGLFLAAYELHYRAVRANRTTMDFRTQPSGAATAVAEIHAGVENALIYLEAARRSTASPSAGGALTWSIGLAAVGSPEMPLLSGALDIAWLTMVAQLTRTMKTDLTLMPDAIDQLRLRFAPRDLAVFELKQVELAQRVASLKLRPFHASR